MHAVKRAQKRKEEGEDYRMAAAATSFPGWAYVADSKNQNRVDKRNEYVKNNHNCGETCPQYAQGP